MTIEERFWSKVLMIPFSECWLWTGWHDADGYGKLAIPSPSRSQLLAHRVSWEIHHGPIPAGKCVLHRCDTPSCINPAHLFLGTQADNMRDMHAKGRGRNGNYGITHCLRGHEFTPENTYARNSGGRACRACDAARCRRRTVERRRSARQSI